MQTILKLSPVLWLLFFSTASDAQVIADPTLQEMQAELKQDLADTNRAFVLVQLSRYYLNNPQPGDDRLDSVYAYLQSAENLCARYPSADWQPEICCFKGKYYLKKKAADKAAGYFRRVTDYIAGSRSVDEQIRRWRKLAFNIYALDTLGLTRIDCFEKIAALYRRQGNKEKGINVEQDIADTHLNQGHLRQAEEELLRVLAKYQAIGFPRLQFTYHLLSKVNRLEGNYNKALDYALLAIRYLETTHDTTSPARTINLYASLARLYDELGQTEKSIGTYRVVFAVKDPEPLDFYMFLEAGIFVRNLIKVQRSSEARDFFMGFVKEHPPADAYSRASVAGTFAYYYRAIHDKEMADRYTEQLIGLAGSLEKNNEIKTGAEYEIGQYFLDKGHFAKAAAHFQLALDEANLNNSAPAMRDIYLMLFKTDSSLGDYVSAIRHLNVFRYLNDSIFTEIKNRQFQEVQAKYETQKKEQNIRLLEKESAIQKDRLTREKYTRNWILGGLGLLLIIVALLLNNVRLKQRTNKQLEMQKKDLRALVTEKEWLLKEIHHRVKNNLHMISGLLDAQSGYLKNSEAVLAIRDSQHRVAAMSLIHQKLYQSADLSVTDMSAYIHELVAYLRASFEICRLHFRVETDPVELSLTHSVPIGLILNEAITNCIKYAFPGDREGKVCILLKRRPGNLFLLSILDDGVGLPANFNRHSGSMGMSLMEGLSEDIGGTFMITGGKGTTITIEFPYT